MPCGDGSGPQMEEGQLLKGVFTAETEDAQGLMFTPNIESNIKIG